LREADPERMQRVLRFIHGRLDRRVGRSDAAHCAGLSGGAFSRFFKTLTEPETPAEP
jgi:transcriptional regulator GlxA family with amidase domain